MVLFSGPSRRFIQYLVVKMRCDPLLAQQPAGEGPNRLGSRSNYGRNVRDLTSHSSALARMTPALPPKSCFVCELGEELFDLPGDANACVGVYELAGDGRSQWPLSCRSSREHSRADRKSRQHLNHRGRWLVQPTKVWPTQKTKTDTKKAQQHQSWIRS